MIGVCQKKFSRVHYEDLWSFYDACKSTVEEEWSRFGKGSCINPVQQFKIVANSSMAQLQL